METIKIGDKFILSDEIPTKDDTIFTISEISEDGKYVSISFGSFHEVDYSYEEVALFFKEGSWIKVKQ